MYGLFLSVLIRFLGTFWGCFLGFSGGGEEQKPKSKDYMQDRLSPLKRTIRFVLSFALQNSAFAETPLRGYQNQTTNYEKKLAGNLQTQIRVKRLAAFSF